MTFTEPWHFVDRWKRLVQPLICPQVDTQLTKLWQFYIKLTPWYDDQMSALVFWWLVHRSLDHCRWKTGPDLNQIRTHGCIFLFETTKLVSICIHCLKRLNLCLSPSPSWSFYIITRSSRTSSNPSPTSCKLWTWNSKHSEQMYPSLRGFWWKENMKCSFHRDIYRTDFSFSVWTAVRHLNQEPNWSCTLRALLPQGPRWLQNTDTLKLHFHLGLPY